jgi:hypothetical protein
MGVPYGCCVAVAPSGPRKKMSRACDKGERVQVAYLEPCANLIEGLIRKLDRHKLF